MQGGRATGNDEPAVMVEGDEGLQIGVSVCGGKNECADCGMEGREEKMESGGGLGG